MYSTFLNFTDLEQRDINEPQPHSGIKKLQIILVGIVAQKKSFVMYGFDIYQEDIDKLNPGELISNSILSVMLR